jgi:uncharacterized protein YciI
MPHFLLTCLDRPDGLERRMGARPAHLEYVQGSALVKLAGPFMSPDGGMIGSMLIIEAPDLAAAKAFSDADPYVAAGVFASVEIREFKPTIGAI